MSNQERAFLENFIVDNEELNKLEYQIYQFNIFEAIGIIRPELRHSNVLVFILSSSQNFNKD